MYRTPITAQALQIQRLIRGGNSPSGRGIISSDSIIIELEPEAFDDYAHALGQNGAQIDVRTIPATNSSPSSRIMMVGRISFMTTAGQ